MTTRESNPRLRRPIPYQSRLIYFSGAPNAIQLGAFEREEGFARIAGRL